MNEKSKDEKDKIKEQEEWVKLVHESACCSHSPHEEKAKQQYVDKIISCRKA